MSKYLLPLLLLSFYSCAQSGSDNQTDATTEEVQTIIDVDKATFAELMKNSEFVLLDVRTPKEQMDGMIEGAQGIDVKAADFVERINQLDKDKTYLVYCKAGSRSTRACNTMAENGFKKMYNLEGGYLGWIAEE